MNAVAPSSSSSSAAAAQKSNGVPTAVESPLLSSISSVAGTPLIPTTPSALGEEYRPEDLMLGKKKNKNNKIAKNNNNNNNNNEIP